MREGCHLSSLLYILDLNLSLRKLETMRSIQGNLGCGKSVLGYADIITVIISRVEHLQSIGEAIKNYEMVAGV